MTHPVMRIGHRATGAGFARPAHQGRAARATVHREHLTLSNLAYHHLPRLVRTGAGMPNGGIIPWVNVLRLRCAGHSLAGSTE